MTVTKTTRGFEMIEMSRYHPSRRLARANVDTFVQASPAVRDDNLGMPGSSCLWIGDDHHLDRTQVAELVAHLQRWLATGSLALPEGTKA